MPLTILDLIVIVVVLISATLAMVRGFVREVLSVASWLIAVAAAYFFYKPLVPLVRPYIESGTVATIVAASAIFFVALIVASYITTKISDFVIDSRVGAIDRGLGFLFGAARGLLLLVIALLFFGWLVQSPPPWISKAMSKPLLDELGAKLMAALPDDIETTLLNKFKGKNGEATTNGDATPGADDSAPADDAAPANDPNYSPGAKRGLDQLIQNSDN
jgi:membrane protein required for colicin V production